MADSQLLIGFRDLNFYSSHFMDLDLWEPHLKSACRRHGFSFGEARPGMAGTFPTFIVSSSRANSLTLPGSVVVKFFGPLFDGAGSFRTEQATGHWLETKSMLFPSPSILAEGELSGGWEYLVFEFVDGMSLGEVRHWLSQSDRQQIARKLGEYLGQLHCLSLLDFPDQCQHVKLTWDGFSSFLRLQRSNVYNNHLRWGDLPAHLLSQLEDFVLPVNELIEYSAAPHLIHADLTADHLLGRLTRAGWQNHAIIDWGDAMTGNILYELVALHMDLFQGDKASLETFLEAYALPDFYQQDFPRKALSMMLLHQFPMPAAIFTPHHNAATLYELANQLFAV